MNEIHIYAQGEPAGSLFQLAANEYLFRYKDGYSGEPVSLTMPLLKSEYHYDTFPPFFEGLLPEGEMLEGLLRQNKIDRNDLFAQLAAVGADMVGAVTAFEVER